MSSSTTTTPAVRSRNGCWTCKIRKKKCDESGPPCQRCAVSELDCAGYGPKPSWLHRKSNAKGKRRLKAPPVNNVMDRSSQQHEAQLLLHYLEKVFPLQWQYYKGPNNWILPLLSGSKAIYHSVLSISAIHRAAEQQIKDDEDLQLHHQLTLQELRNSISTDKNQTGTVQSLAAVVMLISFELFQGGQKNWQHHVEAGVTLVSLITNDGLIPPSTDGEKFLIGCTIWMDLLTCATLYEPCRSSPLLEKLAASPQNMIQLHELMGCRLSVLLKLNEVMKLHTWKTQQKEASRLSFIDLVKRSQQIENELNAAYDSETEDTLLANTTKLFALAILICLYGTVSGYSPDVPEISAAVTKSIPLFQRIPEQYYRGLVFPICAMGSMAGQEHQSQFLRLFGNDPLQLSFGNFAQTREIIMHTWLLRERRGTSFVHWVEAMHDLGLLTLLV